MNPNAFLILKSIPGIGPVWASGMLSEIGDITAFHSSDALAKYAGLYWLKNDSGDFISEDNQVSKSGIRICAIIWEKRLTASGSMCQNTLSIMQKNMLKLPSISTKEHSRLHLVNLYGLFLDCWSKTNCTPAKSWTLNQISTRTDVRLWIFRRRSIKVTLFPEKYIKIFFKNS